MKVLPNLNIVQQVNQEIDKIYEAGLRPTKIILSKKEFGEFKRIITDLKSPFYKQDTSNPEKSIFSGQTYQGIPIEVS